MRTRMSGGVGGVTGAIPSPRPDSTYLILRRRAAKPNAPSPKRRDDDGSGIKDALITIPLLPVHNTKAFPPVPTVS